MQGNICTYIGPGYRVNGEIALYLLTINLYLFSELSPWGRNMERTKLRHMPIRDGMGSVNSCQEERWHEWKYEGDWWHSNLYILNS